MVIEGDTLLSSIVGVALILVVLVLTWMECVCVLGATFTSGVALLFTGNVMEWLSVVGMGVAVEVEPPIIDSVDEGSRECVFEDSCVALRVPSRDSEDVVVAGGVDVVV